MARTVGDRVNVRGVTYRIVKVEGMSHLGSKSFGKFRFTLADAEGVRFRVYGKSVAHNSRITQEA